MTEPPDRNDRAPSVGDSATDPFGRPLGRPSDAADAFGRPAAGRPASAAPVSRPAPAPKPTPAAKPTASPAPSVGRDDATWPTPPTAPEPLGVPAGFPRSAPPAAETPVAPPGSATIALVLGLGGVLFLPLLLSIPAWIVGARARRESRALPGRPGYGMATTGWILGIVATVTWLLLMLLTILGLVAFFSDWESTGTS